MSFRSILYRRIAPNVPTEQAEAPEFFKDLNIDQIVAAVTTGKEEYDLKPFFIANSSTSMTSPTATRL